MNTFWIVVGLITAIPLYVILIRSVLREGTEQSLATWGLWGVLDFITCLSVYLEGGNWHLIALYVLGSVSVCVTLARKKQFSWTWFEWVIVSLVLVCLCVWYYFGAKATTVAGTTAVAIATLSQLRDSVVKPDSKTVKIWFGFTLANLFTTFGAKSWEVKEWLYPAVCTVLCILLVIANKRKTKDSRPVLAVLLGSGIDPHG